MSSVEPNLAVEQAHVALPPKSQFTGFHCLVASPDEARCRRLTWAASDAGWRTTSCPDATTAIAALERMLTQLAIVDLETHSGNPPSGFRELLDYVARQPGLLVLLCGNENRPAEELWARQLGVWLYLPGVGESHELSALCQEARDIVSRLQAQRGAAERFPLERSLPRDALRRPRRTS